MDPFELSLDSDGQSTGYLTTGSIVVSHALKSPSSNGHAIHSHGIHASHSIEVLIPMRPLCPQIPEFERTRYPISRHSCFSFNRSTDPSVSKIEINRYVPLQSSLCDFYHSVRLRRPKLIHFIFFPIPSEK